MLEAAEMPRSPARSWNLAEILVGRPLRSSDVSRESASRGGLSAARAAAASCGPPPSPSAAVVELETTSVCGCRMGGLVRSLQPECMSVYDGVYVEGEVR